MPRKSVALFLYIAFTAAVSGATSTWAGPLKLFVSIAPQKYFVEQIGKDLVEVAVMVPPGASPATYEPKPQQMAALAITDAYLSIGVPFERAWLPKFAAANKKMTLVATDRGIQKRAMADHHHGREQHDHHDHGDAPPVDPHIWTSPPLVMSQARTILAALKELAPAHADKFEANYHAFVAALKALDQELHAIFDTRQGLQFMVFHPSWGYLADTYGLIQVPVEIEGKAPKPAQLKRLITHAKAKEIKVIFVQPQFSAKSAKLIAKAIDGVVIAADPLALDWAANLRRQAAQIKAALR